MKNLRTFPILFISILFIVAACYKLSDNGDLDGRWKLQQIYSKASPEEAHYTLPLDAQADNIYWNFQLNLLAITSTNPLNGHTGETTARFSYTPSHLSVTQTYIHYRDRDSLITDPATTSLTRLGIRGNATDYRIERLNKTSLILCSAYDSLVFYKAH